MLIHNSDNYDMKTILYVDVKGIRDLTNSLDQIAVHISSFSSAEWTRWQLTVVQ